MMVKYAGKDPGTKYLPKYTERDKCRSVPIQYGAWGIHLPSAVDLNLAYLRLGNWRVQMFQLTAWDF